MTDKYILDGHEPVTCFDLMTWGRWMETADRHVANTMIGDGVHGVGVHISTVFLGLDHNFGAEGPPILFETLVFGGEQDEYMLRYTTWKKAEAGHKKTVSMVKATMKKERTNGRQTDDHPGDT